MLPPGKSRVPRRGASVRAALAQWRAAAAPAYCSRMRPPRPLRPLLRLLALLFALGQGVVPAGAAVADARLLAASSGAQGAAHVEPVGGSDCHAVHTDACELCRLLSLQRAIGAAPPAPPARARRVGASAPTAAAASAAAATPLSLPRGPPAA